MIRLKQTMGNMIKCKVDSENMISKYECNLLMSHPLNGLLEIKTEKGAGLIYCGDFKKKLSDRIETGMDEEQLRMYVAQIAQTIVDIKKIGLDEKKLLLNPEWIFLDKEERTVKLIYCPVNGCSMRYESVLFMKDLVLLARLNGDMRKQWNRWLEEISKEGITERKISELSVCIRTERSSIPPVFETGDDGEALTGVDEPFQWDADEDDEAPTGMDDDCIFNGGNYSDGTYREFTKHPMTSENANLPQLIRKSTGETKRIIGNEFKIGRSEQRADFCIRGNNGISNIHAIVVKSGNQYYLQDNHSTNGTYVDGIKLSDNYMTAPLEDGSVIRIYNEELEFHI